MQYVGRFAPTPSGPLHFGSLVTALASWLDARSCKGRWLVRIEDLDPPREMPGASDQILKTLEAFGLVWDDSVLYQSQRSTAYSTALQNLQKQGQAYPCSCTRKELTGQTVYPGYCRQAPRHPERPQAWRFAVNPELTAEWLDGVQGKQSWPLWQLGDVVIRRKDDLWAYQLAVLVDDLEQGITHIVRGIDLLDSTPWQINLLGCLQPGATQFQYSHLPVIVNPAGQKLSKQNRAPAVDRKKASELLYQALLALNQPVEIDWCKEKPQDLLELAIHNWQLNRVPQVADIQERAL